jgi:hypothetical protein
MARNHQEDDEQMALFDWAFRRANSGYLTRLLLHIPNGGYRRPQEAVRLKRLGVRAGVPDILLPVPRNEFHGLWIEMKRPIVKGESKPSVSPEQKHWLRELESQGYMTGVCYGWIEAKDLIESYLG